MRAVLLRAAFFALAALTACAPSGEGLIEASAGSSQRTTAAAAPTTVEPRTPPPTTARDSSLDRRVALRVRNDGGIGLLSTGSGFPITTTRIVTNRHVVEDAYEIEVTTWDGRTIDTQITYYVAEFADLAVVDIVDPVNPVATLNARRLAPGSPIRVVGYPGGGRLTVAAGTVVDHVDGRRFGEDGDVIRIDAGVRPGNSGGPLLAEDGTVVGVVFAIERATGYGLAIPASRLQALVANVER